MDLTKLSDSDLMALKAGDLTKLSDEGLLTLKSTAHPKTGNSAAYDAGTKNPNATVNAANGALFNFGDEIGGAVAATLQGIPGLSRGSEGSTWMLRYRGNRDYLRGQSDQQGRDNPIQSVMLQGAASLPMIPITGGAGMVKGAGIAANAGRAAISGAMSGGLNGAGASTAGDLAGVAADAGFNAGTGAALGGITSPVAAAIGAGARNVSQWFSGQAASDYAREKVAEAIARDARGVAAQAGGDPGSQALARFGKLGPEARVVDAAGRNSIQLLDTLATLPGATKDAAELAIRSRQSGRAGRLITSASDELGAGGRRLEQTVDQISQDRAKAAAPLYAQVDAITIPQPSPSLVASVAAADKLGALGMARKIATADQVSFTLDTSNPAAWTLRDLDRVKKGIDTLVQGETDKAGKVSEVGRSLLGLKSALVRDLDAASIDPATGASVYKAARDAYAGPSAMITAAKLGQKAMAGSDDSIRQTIVGMTASELDAFRVGAFEALRGKLGNSEGGRAEVLGMWKNPGLSEKLKVLFGDERSFRRFAVTAAAESRMKGLESVGRGSQTAARQYGAGDLDVGALKDGAGAVASAAGGNPLSALAAAGAAWNRVKAPEPVRDAMGRILLSRDPAELAGLQDFITRINNQRAGRAVGTGFVSGQASASALNNK